MSSEVRTIAGPIRAPRMVRKCAVLITGASALAFGVALIVLPRTTAPVELGKQLP